MNQSFYTGAVGAYQTQSRMDVHANNIANVNTSGYKAQKAVFSSLLFQNMRNIDEGNERAGVGVRLLSTVTDFTQGAMRTTGRAQDYMIDGDGFFALVDLNSGDVTFTRNGSFSMAELLMPTEEVDEQGNPILESRFCLSDGEGRFVLSDMGTLIEVDDPMKAQSVGVFDYRNYDGILRMEDSRYLPVDKNGGLLRGDGTVVQGALEMSNADLAEELTKVIETQRVYSMALKMVQTSDEIETTINSLRT